MHELDSRHVCHNLEELHVNPKTAYKSKNFKDLGFFFCWVHGLGEKITNLYLFVLLFIVQETKELNHLLQGTFIQPEIYIAGSSYLYEQGRKFYLKH